MTEKVYWILMGLIAFFMVASWVLIARFGFFTIDGFPLGATVISLDSLVFVALALFLRKRVKR